MNPYCHLWQSVTKQHDQHMTCRESDWQVAIWRFMCFRYTNWHFCNKNIYFVAYGKINYISTGGLVYKWEFFWRSTEIWTRINKYIHMKCCIWLLIFGTASRKVLLNCLWSWGIDKELHPTQNSEYYCDDLIVFIYSKWGCVCVCVCVCSWGWGWWGGGYLLPLLSMIHNSPLNSWYSCVINIILKRHHLATKKRYDVYTWH